MQPKQQRSNRNWTIATQPSRAYRTDLWILVLGKSLDEHELTLGAELHYVL